MPATRRPVFDVVIKPQKRSPYSKMAQNELAKELYQLGVFNPQMAEQSLTLLDMMDFDGLEKVKEKVQQGQTLLNMIQQMQQVMVQQSAMIAQLTGQTGQGQSAGGTQAGAQPAPSAPKGESIGKAQKAAQTANMTSYGQRLAQHAKPDMNNA